MCYAYKKTEEGDMPLNRSPNLIDGKKCTSEECPLHLNEIQLEKSSYITYTHNLPKEFYVI